ncbi:hypothetical protein [Ralstonia pseudosolanacearum]
MRAARVHECVCQRDPYPGCPEGHPPAAGGILDSLDAATISHRRHAMQGNPIATRPIRRKLTRLAWLLAGAALPGLAQTPSAPPRNTVAATGGGINVAQLTPAVEALVNANYPHLDVLDKDLHTHPELAFQKTHTAARLAAEMRKLGFDVTEQVGRTGGVAAYRNGPGPTVLVRTEAMLKATFGGNHVMRVAPITASEDVSAFVDTGIPSMFFFTGVNEPQQSLASLKPGAKPLPTNHSPLIAPVPEPSIKTGVEAMSLTVMHALQWNKAAGQSS